jgi:hypothetical protein
MIFLSSIWLKADPVLAGRGCCSTHGGVAGCAGSRLSCSDGTLSPSCSCNDLPASPKVQEALQKASDLKGASYGRGPGQVDCSSAMDKIYPGHFPTSVQTAQGQYQYETDQHEEGLPGDHLQRGDLLYWSPSGQPPATHTGVVASIEDEHITAWHASFKKKSFKKQQIGSEGNMPGGLTFIVGARPR